MKRYIDCDGVILNTEEGLFDRYDEIIRTNPDYSISKYLEEMDWEYWINQAEILNGAIDILKGHDPSCADILTKIHSLNEGRIKVKFFRSHGVKNNIILVPSKISKAEIVSPTGNILLDDSAVNLMEWQESHGYPIYFGSNIGIYPCVTTLEDIFDAEKVKRLTL